MEIMKFLGSCDRIRLFPQGEQFWKAMMKAKQAIKEREFVLNVNVYEFLDDFESWTQYKKDLKRENAEIKYFKAFGNTFFFQHSGFEFIWSENTI